MEKKDMECKLVENKDVDLNGLNNQLIPTIEYYNKKHNTNYSLKDLQKTIEFAAIATKEEKEINKLIESAFINGIFDAVILKAVLAFNYLIYHQATQIMKTEYSGSISEEAVAFMDKMPMWIDSLDKMKEKYHVANLEERLKELKSPKVEEDEKERNKVLHLLHKNMKREIKSEE